jgi:uncharacterized membrane protein YgcG
MRRKIQLLLLLLLIAGTTETGMRASTDCERWMAAYKTQLAQANAAKKLAAAHERVKRLAQKRLANYVKKPAGPKPLLTHYVRPHYTRQQMLDRFNIACGDLPSGPSLVEAKKSPAEFATEMRSYEPVELASAAPEGLIPMADSPSYSPPASEGSGSGFGGPGSGIGGFGGGSGGSGGGGSDTPPVIPVVPVTPVPEPASIVMILTGVAGAAGAARRRWRS